MDKEAYDKEVNTIKFIAADNGYDTGIVDKLIKNKSKNKGQQQIETNRNKYVTLNYGQKFTHKVANIFKKCDYKVSFRTTNKMENFYREKREPASKDIYDDSGVYEIVCGQCPKKYIGQTGRSFRTRWREHLPKNSAEQKSNYAEHLVQHGHSYSKIEDNLKILHKVNKSNSMSVLENYEIFKAVKRDPDNVLNDKVDSQANSLFNLMLGIETAGVNRSRRYQLFPPVPNRRPLSVHASDSAAMT